MTGVLALVHVENKLHRLCIDMKAVVVARMFISYAVCDVRREDSGRALFEHCCLHPMSELTADPRLCLRRLATSDLLGRSSPAFEPIVPCRIRPGSNRHTNAG